MNKIHLRLKPALHYQLITALKAYLTLVIVLCGVMLLLYLLSAAATADGGGFSTTFNGVSMACMIMTFIMGLVNIREDLKMLLQNGCGRLTAWCSNFLTALLLAIGLAVFSELMLFITGAINNSSFAVAGLQMGDALFQLLPFSPPVLGRILILVAFYLLFWQVGLLISLIYYRLSKPGKLILSIAAIAGVVFGLPALIGRFPAQAERLLTAFLSLFGTLAGCICYPLLGALICAGLAWLLLRKAPVIEA